MIDRRHAFSASAHYVTRYTRYSSWFFPARWPSATTSAPGANQSTPGKAETGLDPLSFKRGFGHFPVYALPARRMPAETIGRVSDHHVASASCNGTARRSECSSNCWDARALSLPRSERPGASLTRSVLRVGAYSFCRATPCFHVRPSLRARALITLALRRIFPATRSGVCFCSTRFVSCWSSSSPHGRRIRYRAIVAPRKRYAIVADSGVCKAHGR